MDVWRWFSFWIGWFWGSMLISRGVSRSLQQASLCVARSCFNFMKDSTTLSNRCITLNREFISDRNFSPDIGGFNVYQGKLGLLYFFSWGDSYRVQRDEANSWFDWGCYVSNKDSWELVDRPTFYHTNQPNVLTMTQFPWFRDGAVRVTKKTGSWANLIASRMHICCL